MKNLIKQAFTSWPYCIPTYVAIAMLSVWLYQGIQYHLAK